MGPFEMTVAIVGMAFIFKLAKLRMERRDREREHQGNPTRDAELLARLDKLEKRVANLETLVLEAEKKREFERVL